MKLIRIKEKNTRNWVDNAQTADVVYTISKVKKTGELETTLKVILDSIDASSNMWTRTDPQHIHSQIDVNIERDRPQILGYFPRNFTSRRCLKMGLCEESGLNSRHVYRQFK